MRTLIMGVVGLVVLSANLSAETIHYSADVVPDHSSLQNVFSTHMTPGPSWSVSAGELTLTTTHPATIWFGNHSEVDPVPWDLADSSEGNFLSVRAKLAPSSSNWQLNIYDGNYRSNLRLAPDYLAYFTLAGYGNSYPIDTSEYHVYSILLADGRVIYQVDGNEVYSGAAAAYSLKTLVTVGDGGYSANPDWGITTGSMLVDEVTIITHIPEPSTLVLLCMSAVGLLAYAWRRRRRLS